MNRLLAPGVAALIIVAATAAAQQPAPPPGTGRLNTFACNVLPAQVTLDIVLLDNADDNLPVKDAFARSLGKRNVKIVPGAALVLTLGIETVREAKSVKPPDLFDVQVGQSNTDAARAAPDDTSIGDQGFATVHANIWSNRRDSVLGGRRYVVEGDMVDEVKLSASLNRRTDGRCLWQGEAIRNLDGADPARAALGLAPILARAFGKSIKDKPLRDIR